MRRRRTGFDRLKLEIFGVKRFTPQSDPLRLPFVGVVGRDGYRIQDDFRFDGADLVDLSGEVGKDAKIAADEVLTLFRDKQPVGDPGSGKSCRCQHGTGETEYRKRPHVEAHATSFPYASRSQRSGRGPKYRRVVGINVNGSFLEQGDEEVCAGW